MKKNHFVRLLAFSFCLLAGQVGFTQSMTNPEETATRISMEMVQVLDLTETQIEQVREINYDYAKKIYAVQLDEVSDPLVFGQLLEQRNQALLTVISEEQLQTWQAVVDAKAKEKAGHVRGN